jgi:exonuclease III
VQLHIVSVNLSKKLRSTKNTHIIEKWLSDKNADLLFVQEPWERGRKEIVGIQSYLYLGGTDGIGTWIHKRYVPRCTELLKENWQKLTLDSLVIHNVYLSASSSKKRVELLEQLTTQISKEKSSPVLVVGDFNLAPDPEDGLFGKESSKFTSKKERDAFKLLLSTNCLIDSTASKSLEETRVFTFEREMGGKKSCFRCDLALVNESVMDEMKVEYDHSARTGEESFTDHSAILIDIPDSLAGIKPGEVNSHKTAIPRKNPSLIAKRLSAFVKSRHPDKKINRIFDYGCGKGEDVDFYKKEFGCEVGAWDPYSDDFPDCPYDKYDIVTCIYVLNVLSDVTERCNTIKRAISYVADNGFLVVATRSVSEIDHEASSKSWTPFNDGYYSSESRGTFQKGIDAEELENYLSNSGLKVKLTTPSEMKVQGATVVLIEPLQERDL